MRRRIRRASAEENAKMDKSTITITFVNNYYRVSGTLGKRIPWSRINGYVKYDDGKTVHHCVPAAMKRRLWTMLKIHANGQTAIGPKGKFVIGEK